MEYIYWRYVDETKVTPEEMKNLLNKIESTAVKVEASKTKVSDWYKDTDTYNYQKGLKYSTLYYCKVREDGCHELYKYNTNIYSSSVIDYKNSIFPSTAGSTLKKKFKELSGTTLKTAYGTTNSSEFMNFTPKPIYYIERRLAFKTLRANAIDVSSMYPACARGKLPDQHTMKVVDEYVKPNEEYPFAFYPDTNHCSEYNVFDTHDYVKLPTRWMRALCFNDAGKAIYNDCQDTKTILMKASEYEMTKTFEYFSDLKNNSTKDSREYLISKAIQNMGIGTLHPNPKNRRRQTESINAYYHICAIILGRANALQLKTANEIEDAGGVIVEMVVDSILYLGDIIGTDKKELGKYHIDTEDGYLRITDGINRYVLFDKDKKKVKQVISGIEIEQQPDIQFENIEAIDVFRRV